MAEKSPLFLGITRPPKVMGLPVGYFVSLLGAAFLPFVIFDTAYFLLIFIIGYPPLYFVADRNPNLIEVFITTTSKTPKTPNRAAHGSDKYVS